MARPARVVVPGAARRVTQHGNRRQRTFFRDSDYEDYLLLLAAQCVRRKVEIWCYCLMPNHVHLIARPTDAEGLRLAIGEAPAPSLACGPLFTPPARCPSASLGAGRLRHGHRTAVAPARCRLRHGHRTAVAPARICSA